MRRPARKKQFGFLPRIIVMMLLPLLVRPVLGQPMAPPPGRSGPGARDPEVQKRLDEIRNAGVPTPPDMPTRNPGFVPVEPPRPNRPGNPAFPDPRGVATRNRPRLPEIGSEWWMGWWEINRERYWPVRGGVTPTPPESTPTRVLHALAIASGSNDALVRAQAALALSMARHPKAMEHLARLTGDTNESVAIHAWAAVGLLNTPDATEFLETPPKARRDVPGWIMAVALSDKPTEAMWNVMPQTVDDSGSIEAQRLALAALRHHLPPNARELFLQAFERSVIPVLKFECLRGLAKLNHPEDITNLVNLARENYGAVTWESVRVVYAEARARRSGLVPRNFSEVQSLHERILSQPLRRGDRNPAAAAQRQAVSAAYRALPRLALYALAELDSPSDPAISAMINDLTGGRTFITRPQGVDPPKTSGAPRPYPREQELLPTQDPAIVVGVGKLPAGQDAGIIQYIIDWGTPSHILPRAGIRATAAAVLSRGLYYWALTPAADSGRSRPLANLTTPVTEEDLIRPFQMENEDINVRAASALAMGLGGKPILAERAKHALRTLKPGQELVWGYGILALGMLGDPQSIELAAQYLGPAKQQVGVEEFLAREGSPPPIPVPQLIARRAAVAGLAALGDSRALPILYGEWGKNPFLDLEIARAIARCRASRDVSPPGQPDPFVEAMIRLAIQERNPAAAASAVVMLGALHDTGQRARLGILVAGPSPDILPPAEIGQTERVLALGNPFYYLVLRRPNPTRPDPAPNP